MKSITLPLFLRIPFFIVTLLVFNACTNVPTTPSQVSASSLAVTPTPQEGISAQLGPVPQHCSAGPRPQSIDPNFGPMVGANAVWAGNFVGPQAVLEWTPSFAKQFHNQYGWGHKLLWVVADTTKNPVTIFGENLHDGSPLRPTADDQASASTSTKLVLHPQEPGTLRHINHWLEFPGGLTIPAAGCYRLRATWPGGSWQITFAAGEVTN